MRTGSARCPSRTARAGLAETIEDGRSGFLFSESLRGHVRRRRRPRHRELHRAPPPERHAPLRDDERLRLETLRRRLRVPLRPRSRQSRPRAFAPLNGSRNRFYLGFPLRIGATRAWYRHSRCAWLTIREICASPTVRRSWIRAPAVPRRSGSTGGAAVGNRRIHKQGDDERHGAPRDDGGHRAERRGGDRQIRTRRAGSTCRQTAN